MTDCDVVRVYKPDTIKHEVLPGKMRYLESLRNTELVIV